MSSTQTSILLVADDDSIQKFLRHALERANFKVIKCADDDAAAAFQQPLSEVVPDIHMPKLIRRCRHAYQPVLGIDLRTAPCRSGETNIPAFCS